MSDEATKKHEERAGEVVIAVVPVEPEKELQRGAKTSRNNQPLWHVIIWNDEEHSYDYVIELLMKLFGHSQEAAYAITDEVHHRGRGLRGHATRNWRS